MGVGHAQFEGLMLAAVIKMIRMLMRKILAPDWGA
jgi:hypothetical protein